MEEMEVTLAKGTGLYERKVHLDDQSFIFVPSPSESSSKSLIPAESDEKHELVTVANSRTKVLIIPDYLNSTPDSELPTASAHSQGLSQSLSRANSKELVSPSLSDAKEKVDGVSSKIESTSRTSLSCNKGSHVAETSSEAQTPQTVTMDTPLTDIKTLEPLMLEILEVQGPIKTVSEFLDMKRTHTFLYQFLKESGVARNIDQLIENVSNLLPSSPKVESKERESISQENLEVKEDSLLLKRKNEVESFPIAVIDGLGQKDGKGSYITQHAYIYTVGELARFPETFPSIYAMLKETARMYDLDSYVERAKELIALGNMIASKTDLSTSSLSKTLRPIDLEKSWLRPSLLTSSGTRKTLDVLVKPPFRSENVKVNADTSIFALEGLESHEVELLMTYPQVPIKTLRDLASIDELTSEKEKTFLTSRIPLLEQFVLHSKALCSTSSGPSSLDK